MKGQLARDGTADRSTQAFLNTHHQLRPHEERVVQSRAALDRAESVLAARRRFDVLDWVRNASPVATLADAERDVQRERERLAEAEQVLRNALRMLPITVATLALAADFGDRKARFLVEKVRAGDKEALELRNQRKRQSIERMRQRRGLPPLPPAMRRLRRLFIAGPPLPLGRAVAQPP